MAQPASPSNSMSASSSRESLGGRRRSRERSMDGDTSIGGSSSAQPPATPPLAPQSQHQPRRLSGSGSGSKDGSARRTEDTFRDEIVRQIFGENLGCIRDDASCAVESKILLHGRMYITDKFVCFYSNFFGFEKKIKIPFSHVRTLSKGNTALLIPNGINIQTMGKEYCFRSFWDRDEVFLQMAQCFRAYHRMPPVSREAIMECRSVDRAGNLETAAAAAAAAAADSAGSRTTTPTPISSSATPAVQQQQQQQQQQQPPQQESNSRALSPAVSAASTSPRGAAIPPPLELPPPDGHAAAEGEEGGGSHDSSEEGVLVPSATEGPHSLGSVEEDDMLDFDDLREGTQNIVSEGDLGAAFAVALEGPPLKERGLEFMLPKVTVQEFFEDFISDKAALGVDKYHEWEGDTEIEVTPWQEVNQGVGATRTIHFVTSLEGLPVGPPTALVMQMQRVRVFGQHGMILETSSSMEKIPAGDCFTLEDRWIVRPLPADEGGNGGGLSIETSFEVKFVKSTFFRKIIESRSRADTLQYHRRWFEMIEKRAARKHHERPPSRPHAHARRPAHPPRRAVGAGGAVGGKAAGGGGGRGGGAVAAGGGRGHAHVAGAGEGALSMVLEPILDLLKRIKWDRFVLAVLVFTCLFYFLRLVLNAVLPSAYHIGPGGGVGVDPGTPPALTPKQWKDIVMELVALRIEVQEMRGELRALAERLPPVGQ